MGIQIKEKINDFNIIIRTDNNNMIFFTNDEGYLGQIAFNIYTQFFDYSKELEVSLFLSYLPNDSSSNKLKFLTIGNYIINKDGFNEKDENNNQCERKHHLAIGITDGFRSDLHLNFTNVKLLPGRYEINIATKIDGKDKIIGLYPFEVKQKNIIINKN